jgi:hypothetical protein
LLKADLLFQKDGLPLPKADLLSQKAGLPWPKADLLFPKASSASSAAEAFT